MAMPSSMLLPEDALVRLRAQWRRRRGEWLLDPAAIPDPVPLRPPNQAQVEADWPRFDAWLTAWRRTGLPGEIEWGTRNWSRLGSQSLPRSWRLHNVQEVAQALGEGGRWPRAVRRAA
ncbi:DUF3322 domain-containing protein, partial [Stenotrophomonas sp. YIM B06876]|uniref:DUF3322 domain-containing protein n=1 Tax=Stenotrophomonas sp. YIM B06876 TaxID=3060211 RepID=UPI002739D96C